MPAASITAAALAAFMTVHPGARVVSAHSLQSHVAFHRQAQAAPFFRTTRFRRHGVWAFNDFDGWPGGWGLGDDGAYGLAAEQDAGPGPERPRPTPMNYTAPTPAICPAIWHWSDKTQSATREPLC
jgi:hypothetical protein